MNDKFYGQSSHPNCIYKYQHWTPSVANSIVVFKSWMKFWSLIKTKSTWKLKHIFQLDTHDSIFNFSIVFFFQRLALTLVRCVVRIIILFNSLVTFLSNSSNKRGNYCNTQIFPGTMTKIHFGWLLSHKMSNVRNKNILSKLIFKRSDKHFIINFFQCVYHHSMVNKNCPFKWSP